MPSFKYTHQELAFIANELRQLAMRMIYLAGSGHPAGSLGMADIFSALYFSELKYRFDMPTWSYRDRVILSNGHICPVYYAALAHAGFFSKNKLWSLRKFGTDLQGHPHRDSLPGLETSSGPLGSGLSQGCGMALAARMDHHMHRVVVLTSDGEHQEGNTWEAVMLAAKYKLGNLIQIMDRNNIQIDGSTDEIMPLDPLDKKYEAFGWNVIAINGHRFAEIQRGMREASRSRRPTLILATTIPGHGVSFMENNYRWHGKAPNEEQYMAAMTELSEVRERILGRRYEF